ncbi:MULTISPECIES: SsgA family sporulation/cell division regulator [unclassified Streptomyces]|uniref:SsgA family sporulation/cell division regulator n=1 Tax=unclassified Streptomyces TaxID=2593676 RepID=UPI000DB91B22|nr:MULTISPECIES: SsgA family sporulation/cell division regulator [unclassified Streptomyces]MYT71764.1 SsgA family sporulation/cell division regulator [Streptomyces sp. SID8367]RAJ72598.1 sporulation and cell division protein SsgA [Streptomyces sp. PsTaAH-137]
MSGNHPGVQAPRTAPCDSSPHLVLDIERVLDVSARQAVRAEFRFDPGSPLVVHVELLIEDGPCVLWRIGRDLLHQGLYSVSGLGDVRIWSTRPEGDPATARLQLASGDMAALFELPVPPLAEWLEHTYELVPAGQELSAVDWDVATADLLQDPTAQSD